MNQELGDRLQELRKKNGYSQEELADKLEVSRQAVSKWERGDSAPDTENLIALADLYGASLDELVGRKEPSESIKEDIIKEETEKPGVHITLVEGEEKEDEDDDKDVDDSFTKGQKRVVDIVSAITLFGGVSAFLIIGFILHIWHPTWTIFFLLPVTSTLTEAIIAKKPSHFAFPVLVAGLYCLFSSLFGLWHPLWIVFITIPAYYLICSVIEKK